MKILQINKHHFIKGGADKVYFNTISMLEKHGHEVVTFSTLRPENYGSEYSGYFVPFVDNRNKNVLSNLFQAGHYLYNGNASKTSNDSLRHSALKLRICICFMGIFLHLYSEP